MGDVAVLVSEEDSIFRVLSGASSLLLGSLFLVIACLVVTTIVLSAIIRNWTKITRETRLIAFHFAAFTLSCVSVKIFDIWGKINRDAFAEATATILAGFVAITFARHLYEYFGDLSFLDSIKKVREEATAFVLPRSRVGMWKIQVDHGDIVEMEWDETTSYILRTDLNEIEPSIGAFFSAIHPEDVDRVKESIYGEIEHEGVFSCIFRILDGEGEWSEVMIRGGMFFDLAGKPSHLSGIIAKL